MTVSSTVTPIEAVSVVRDERPQFELDGTQDGGIAQRVPAALMPSITGVRFLPADVVAELVNISTSGMLVECCDRLKPGSAVTVIFAGSFRPAPVASRVARAAVSRIGQDGALRYHIGIAFVAPIALPAPAEAGPDTPPIRHGSPAQQPALAVSRQEPLRNCW